MLAPTTVHRGRIPPRHHQLIETCPTRRDRVSNTLVPTLTTVVSWNAILDMLIVTVFVAFLIGRILAIGLLTVVTRASVEDVDLALL